MIASITSNGVSLLASAHAQPKRALQPNVEEQGTRGSDPFAQTTSDLLTLSSSGAGNLRDAARTVAIIDPSMIPH